MLIELATLIGYGLLIAYYFYVSTTMLELDNSRVKTTFLIFNGLFIFLFWGYKLYKYYSSKTGTETEKPSILGIDNLYFIVAMSIYLTLILGSFTNIGFRTFFIILLVLVGLVILPIIYKKLFGPIINKIFNTTSTETGNLFQDAIYPFYTSQYFIIIAIMILFGVILSSVKMFNIPNIGTWQLWATIATIIFGVKYILLYKFSYYSRYLVFGLLAVLAILIYFMIQNTKVNQSTLTALFSIACIILSILIPTTVPYIGFGLFILSLTASLSLGLFTQRINFSTVKVLFSILALYLAVHFSNDLSTNKSNDPGNNPIFKYHPAISLYIIAWALITTFYFTDLEAANKNINSVTISVSIFVFLITICVIGFLELAKNEKWAGEKSKNILDLTEGSLVGILMSSIGTLLITYYLLSTTYSAHLNYSIVFLILMFMFFSFLLMIYNLKNILQLAVFFLFVFIPIIFIYLFKNSFSGSGLNQSGSPLKLKDTGMFIGGVWLILIWFFLSIVFWNSSGITFETLWNMNSITITLAGFLIYLVFYYLYITFTSKESMPQKFSQVILIIICMYLFLQIFKKSQMASNPFISFLINLIEYIPCLYDYALTSIMNLKMLNLKTGTMDLKTGKMDLKTGMMNLKTGMMNLTPGELMKEDFTYHSGGTMIISGIVVISILYYFYPTLSKWFAETTHTPGITLVGDSPLSINETHMIKTYEELTKNPEKPLYNYGISFDLYINPSSANDNFYQIINFSGNLVVTYNTNKNQLYIYALSDSGDETPPEVALYRYNQFPLQKWVKIEVNYVGGIYDVFVDDKIKTSNKVVSYNSHANIFVGEAGSSVVGKVKNFIYYEKPLSLYQVQHTK
jgi:hypothetical protein